MALILCPKCGKVMGSMAKGCAQCGYSIVENALEEKVRKIIKADCGLAAMDYLETQGYSREKASDYVHDFINKHPECITNKFSDPAPLQCPKCGNKSVKEALFSLYDYKCGICGHEWVRCPKCGGCNIDIMRVTPLRALKRSWNTCKNCGHKWRRPSH